MKTVVVTGALGFIGRNLCVRLGELGEHEIVALGRGDGEGALRAAAARADVVVHLAGVNRPHDPAEFVTGNEGATRALCAALAATGNPAPILYASSAQAATDNPYGASKRAAEAVLLAHAETGGGGAHLFRLPNVFGKWARPDYNSAVATFCHNIAHGLPIRVNDPAATLRLVYVDDVVDAFLALIEALPDGSGFREVAPVYETSVGAVAEMIGQFRASRDTLITARVGTGLSRALYATYTSYLAPADFAYPVALHQDQRGVFVEMLKTLDSGQFSYLTSGPGITRGDHYHHSKIEKFLVVSGTAHFAFRHILTGEVHELVAAGGDARIVETIPGWTHNITNVGTGELVVLLWANEIFDRQRPDTIAMKVAP